MSKPSTLNLRRAHLDALNVTLNWFGGEMNKSDAYVASIDSAVLNDLVDLEMLRKQWLGWSYQITLRGREALSAAGITRFSDTRVW